MQAYLDIIRRVIDHGSVKENRTVVDTIAVPGVMFEHDMADGFPLLTTKFVPIGVVGVELEGFLQGITDKGWYRERKCHIWDEWCSPEKVAYGHDAETQEKMMAERDLGPIYSWQWRHFGAPYEFHEGNHTFPDVSPGVDQIQGLLDKLKAFSNDRAMLVSAWNPMDTAKMALPPCHWGWQVTVIGGRIHLLWNQRSVDVGLGLPFNIAFYALLLKLIAAESGFEPGRLVGFLADTHIYTNHIDGLTLQLSREPFKLPEVSFKDFKGVLEWDHTNIHMPYYDRHPHIPLEVAV